MRIRILKGKLEGHSFEMNSDNFLIGRAPESDIQIPDPSISRQHAKIFKSGKKYYIKDLKSCNGTWVDGRLIWPGNEIELRQGLRLSVGDTLLTLDNFDSGGSSTFSYSIDLASVREQGSMDFIFKDRRMAKRKNLELICEITETLLRPLELEAICNKILEYIFYSLKRISSCSILMLDKNNDNIYKLMDKTRDSHPKGDVNYSRSIVRQVVNEGNAVMIADLDNEGETEPSESIKRMSIKSIMCVPLISKNDIIGVLYAHSVDEPKGFRKDDLYMLVALSSYASIAIDNATQYALKKQGRHNIDLQIILRQQLETIKSLAGVISHEFNNLLMCIQGETSLLLHDTPKQDPKYERVKQIEKYIGKGAELSALACGFPVAPQHLKTCSDLNRIATDSVNTFAHLPGDTFQLETAPDLWPVNIDERQVLHALTNVYSFLVSFKNRGIINIRCENLTPGSLTQELSGFESDRLVTISVRDEKHFLDKNDLLEIFTPGINLEIGTGPNISAGLISAYWIVEKNMGRLVVTSDKERGTEFCIYLPAENQAEAV
ncbi:MAG: FHA domain-containing protein [Desulfobacteraceae bacterium]